MLVWPGEGPEPVLPDLAPPEGYRIHAEIEVCPPEAIESALHAMLSCCFLLDGHIRSMLPDSALSEWPSVHANIGSLRSARHAFAEFCSADRSHQPHSLREVKGFGRCYK